MDVVVFVNRATETSIPLEVAESSNGTSVSVLVYSFFDPDENTSEVEIRSLAATSQVDFGAYRRLYTHLKKDQPDVFHVHPNATGSVARVIAKIAGVPSIVTTEHNDHGKFGHLKNAVNGGTNWLNDIVVCNSESTANSFSRWENALLSLAGTQKTVIYNGVDVDAVETAGSERSPPPLPNEFVFGTAGRLVEQKNIEAIVEAIAKLDDCQNVHVAIAGKGDREDVLKQHVREKGVDDQVEFLGFLPERADVYAFFDEIDVFLFPSHYEGFGVAVAEAMATGTPPIVNDIEVLKEVVGDSGLFVDATDPGELSSAMRTLYEDEHKRRKLGENAEVRIKTRFPLEKTVADHVALYRNVSSE